MREADKLAAEKAVGLEHTSLSHPAGSETLPSLKRGVKPRKASA